MHQLDTQFSYLFTTYFSTDIVQTGQACCHRKKKRRQKRRQKRQAKLNLSILKLNSQNSLLVNREREREIEREREQQQQCSQQSQEKRQSSIQNQSNLNQTIKLKQCHAEAFISSSRRRAPIHNLPCAEVYRKVARLAGGVGLVREKKPFGEKRLASSQNTGSLFTLSEPYVFFQTGFPTTDLELSYSRGNKSS